MPTYYVATLASYVLVDAESESHARELGLAALRDLHPERAAPFNICTVRLATDEECKLMAWHYAKVAAEGQKIAVQRPLVAHEARDGPRARWSEKWAGYKAARRGRTLRKAREAAVFA